VLFLVLQQNAVGVAVRLLLTGPVSLPVPQEYLKAQNAALKSELSEMHRVGLRVCRCVMSVYPSIYLAVRLRPGRAVGLRRESKDLLAIKACAGMEAGERGAEGHAFSGLPESQSHTRVAAGVHSRRRSAGSSWRRG
jgi:hypothetical protein